MNLVSYEVLAGFYDRLMNEVDYDQWYAYVLDLVEKVKSEGISSPSCRVLDLACGTGEFAYRLAGQGFKVTAVDISEAMLAVAEAKARSRGKRVQFLLQDMRTFTLPDEYDVVLCLCDSLNYLLDSAHWLDTFRRVIDVLKPGGVFIFDVNTPYKLAEVYGDYTYAEDQEDFAYIWENDYDPSSGICRMDLTFFIQKSPTTNSYSKVMETHTQLGLSQATIKKLLSQAELELLGSYGDLTYEVPGEEPGSGG